MTTEIENIADELEHYAEREGTEVGEYWTALCEIARYPYAMGDQFEKAFLKEIASQLDYARDNMEPEPEPLSDKETIQRLASTLWMVMDGMDDKNVKYNTGLSDTICERIVLVRKEAGKILGKT